MQRSDQAVVAGWVRKWVFHCQSDLIFFLNEHYGHKIRSLDHNNVWAIQM